MIFLSRVDFSYESRLFLALSLRLYHFCIFRMLRFALLAALASAAKVLVLYENPQVKISHSKVIAAMEAHGLELTFKVSFYYQLDTSRLINLSL